MRLRISASGPFWLESWILGTQPSKKIHSLRNTCQVVAKVEKGCMVHALVSSHGQIRLCFWQEPWLYKSHYLAMLEQSNMPLKTQDPVDLDPGPCQDRVLRRGFEHRLT